MTLYRANIGTLHFEFEGYGSTAEEAVAVCHDGWLTHCRKYRPRTTIDPEYIKAEDITAYEIALGTAYRDREPI